MPDKISLYIENIPSTDTLNLRFVRKSLITSNNLHLIPIFSSLSKSL